MPYTVKVAEPGKEFEANDRKWPTVLVRECPQSRGPSQRLAICARKRTVFPNNRPDAVSRILGVYVGKGATDR